MAMSDIPENGPVVYKVIWCAGGCLCFVEYVVLTDGTDVTDVVVWWGCWGCICVPSFMMTGYQKWFFVLLASL